MTTVTSATNATTTSTATSTASNGLSSDYETFLKLLTTQMTNQDPTDPMDSADYAVQLATFSQVEQQTKTNELIENLALQLGLMGMSEYAGWVGMDARSESPAYFDGANSVTISPNPVVGATETVLVVNDAAGNEVARETIPVSADSLEWDGTDASGNPLPAGNYSFNLESYNNGTLLSTDPVETYNRIVEAQGTANGAVLVLQGGATIETGSISALRDGG
ncbi:flagellar basal body rod modification protein [Rhodobacter sp. TJ_12]|uniref:flagellar hook capping FlgD N-terminal domain-containing protein n=1 Tax=Rhodobacter sp. TJ_12 TaxID=2029399 RepID=UPI001CBFCCEC|nr:flagellar hook capping FlgD N-terminal domain-containing protein [Rhodobacter sp. TJ_12]MBZ4022046.1 flagellar basal body rod modification protein [Rhodobacter sp. TJ_12]